MKLLKRFLLIVAALVFAVLGYGVYLNIADPTFLLELKSPVVVEGNRMALHYAIEEELEAAEYDKRQGCLYDYVAYHNDYMKRHDCYADSSKGKAMSCSVTVEDYEKEHRCPKPKDTPDGYMVLRRDENMVATFSHLYVEGRVGFTEVRVYYRNLPNSTKVAIDPAGVILKEGQVAYVPQIKYAVFKLDDQHKLVLQGFANAAYEPIRP